MNYNNYNDTQSTKEENSEKDATSSAKNSHGFKNDSEERMWMNQVRSECVHSYVNRMR